MSGGGAADAGAGAAARPDLARRARALRERDAGAAGGLPGGAGFRGAWGALGAGERRRVYGEARGMVQREALCVIGAGSLGGLLAGCCPELTSDAWATLKGEPVVALVERTLAGPGNPGEGGGTTEARKGGPWPPLPPAGATAREEWVRQARGSVFAKDTFYAEASADALFCVCREYFAACFAAAAVRLVGQALGVGPPSPEKVLEASGSESDSDSSGSGED